MNHKEHNQLNIEQQEPHLKPEVNPGAPEGWCSSCSTSGTIGDKGYYRLQQIYSNKQMHFTMCPKGQVSFWYH